MKKLRHLWILVAVALFAMGAAGAALPTKAVGKRFTPREVAEIKSLLAKRNRASYRVVLPVFKGQARVGSETLGTLPFTEVRRLASQRGLTVHEKGNLQAVLLSDTAGGGGGGGGEGGGAGSHTPSGSGATGIDVIERIQATLSNVGESEYLFIH